MSAPPCYHSGCAVRRFSKMRRLYIMYGIAFSGKTTVAEQLVQALGCGYLSLDDINAEKGPYMAARILRSENENVRTASHLSE
jgi:hypothetical protein